MREDRNGNPLPLAGKPRVEVPAPSVVQQGADTPTSNSSPQGGGGQGGVYPHLSGMMVDGAHVLPVRVYYEDTDFIETA